jgi:carboxymethylenebutenolidase
MMPELTIPTLDGAGRFAAYAAGPVGGPAIIVVQEIFGVNGGIRAKCDALATDGWRAVAPDLFWRDEPGLQLDPDTAGDFKRALAILNRYSLDDGVQDIEATLRFVRAEGSAKVGVVGYCMGGGLAFLAATRTDSDASIGYYGAPIPNYLGEAHGIARPLMLHFAGDDHFIPADKVAAVHAALDPNPHVTIHEYAGVDHGFATQTGARRVADAADLADGRTLAFFAEHLR